MSREIKFRAYSERVGMYEVDVLAIGGVSWSCGSKNGVSMAYQPHIEVMQFTGLKDKNGNDIYEGDIIEYDNGTKAKVIFKEGCFCGYDGSATSSDEAYTLLFDDSAPFEDGFELEIIGNIHQNPELLK